MANPKLDTFEGALDSFFKFHSDGTSAYAGSVTFTNFLTDQKATDAVGALVSLVQLIDSFLFLVKDTPLGTTATAVSIGNNLAILKDQQAVDGVNPAIVVSLISDISALAAGGALAMGPAGVAPFIVLSSISLVASVYATNNGISIDRENDALLLRSTQALDQYQVYGQTHWDDYTNSIFTEFFKKNPVTLPVLALLHEIESTITPSQALGVIESAGISNLLDGRIPEVSKLIQSLVKICFGSDTSAVSTKQEVNDKINGLWDSFKNSPLAGHVTFVAPPTSASAARADLGAFLSLYYLTPFALKANDAGALNQLYVVHEDRASQWIADKTLTAEQIAQGEAFFSDNWLNVKWTPPSRQ